MVWGQGTRMPKASGLGLVAGADVRQVARRVTVSKVKGGQMFSDGYGGMTGEGVKFSFERIGLPPKDGARGPHAGS